MTTGSHQTTPEFSRPFGLIGVGPKPEKVTLSAEKEERGSLAKRFGLQELDHLLADVSIRRRSDTGWIVVSGSLEASVVQTCVVTLEPVLNEVRAEIEESFDDNDRETGIEIDLDPTAELPEPIDSDEIDLGEIVAQTLALALDPYPRSPSASDADTLEFDGTPAGTTSDVDRPAESQPSDGMVRPFAGLEALRNKLAREQDVKKG